jgi:hypothetical protein
MNYNKLYILYNLYNYPIDSLSLYNYNKFVEK